MVLIPPLDLAFDRKYDNEYALNCVNSHFYQTVSLLVGLSLIEMELGNTPYDSRMFIFNHLDFIKMGLMLVFYIFR